MVRKNKTYQNYGTKCNIYGTKSKIYGTKIHGTISLWYEMTIILHAQFDVGSIHVYALGLPRMVLQI